MKTLTIATVATFGHPSYYYRYRGRYLGVTDHWNGVVTFASTNGYTHYKLITSHINAATITKGKF